MIAYTSQLVPDLKDALAGIREKYGNKIPSMISVITGPSRTADIEKTLVMGAHGPKEIYVFLTELTEQETEEEGSLSKDADGTEVDDVVTDGEEDD